MPNDKDFKGAYSEEHHLIQEKITPDSFNELRTELAKPENKDISDDAQNGKTIEECLGRIAACLDIALDGLYDIPSLCTILVNSIRKRHEFSHYPHLRDDKLVNVEMRETADAVELIEKQEASIGTVVTTENPDKTSVDRYVICDSCVTSFDCIVNKTCNLKDSKSKKFIM